jgi:hypothetical protein
MTDERNNRGWEVSAWVGVIIVLAFLVVSGIYWAGSNKSDTTTAGAPASQTSAPSKNATTGSGSTQR